MPSELTKLELSRLFSKSEYDKALTVCDRALAEHPEQSDLWQFKGDTLIKLKRYQDALEPYDRALALGTLTPLNLQKLWNNYGVALIHSGRYGEALAALDRGEQVTPGRAGTAINRGYIQVRIGRYAEALPYFDIARQLDPSRVESLTNTAFALVCIGRFPEAHRVIEVILRAQPRNGHAWGARGLLELQVSGPSVALASLRTALEYQPTYAATHVTCALALLVMGDAEHARQSVEEALRLDPADARTWQAHALALRAAGRWDEAAAADQRGAAMLAEQSAQVDAYNMRSRLG